MPASIKYHHTQRGGLYTHTLEVMEHGIALFNTFNESAKNVDISLDDVILTTFAHDLDKINKYVDHGNRFLWNYGRIDVNDTADVVNILSRYGIYLNDIQLNALTFSHGGWSVDRGKMKPLATIVHCADILSLTFENKVEQNFRPHVLPPQKMKFSI